jgi:RimJ/RimL family protein N-acetyltransferase
MNAIELGKEIDKVGNVLTIYQSLELGMSPAFSLFLQHYAETVKNGHAFPITTWNDKTCGVIYAVINNEIVGQITYDKNNYNAPGSIWIVLSSVSEYHRGKGIYKILHKYLDKFAKDNNFPEVASFVHVKNELQLRALKSVGKNPIFYVVGKRI